MGDPHEAGQGNGVCVHSCGNYCPAHGHSGRTEVARVFSAKFSDVNNAFTIKGPGGLGAFGFTSRCLLMFNNKKWIGGRDKVQHQEGQQRLSWTRETLPSLLQKH